MGEYNSERAKQRLLARIRHDKSKIRRDRRQKVFQYAAVVFVFLGLGYGYYRLSVTDREAERLVDYENSITIKLSDGSIKNISENKETSLLNKSGLPVGVLKGGELIYNNGKTSGELAYNTVSIPYGKRFVLTLSDGTRAHLNSGSTLRYPVRFGQGRNREVFLKGEGHFEVTKDRVHPFLVNTDAINVRVLGTRFNISAYPEDAYVNTVLVEGSVSLFGQGQNAGSINPKILEPGHMASWEKRERTMTIEEADTNLYTDWMDGKIVFDHMPFREILKKLERHYNVSISNDYSALDEIRFTARFDTETVDEVLRAFKKNHPIHYTIDGRKILIKKP